MNAINVGDRVRLKNESLSQFEPVVIEKWNVTFECQGKIAWRTILILQVGVEPPFLSPEKYWEPVAPRSEPVLPPSPVGPPAGTASV